MVDNLTPERIIEIAAKHIGDPEVMALAAHALHVEGAVLELRHHDDSNATLQPVSSALVAASERLRSVLSNEPEYAEADDMATAAVAVIERLRGAVDSYSVAEHEMAAEEHRRLRIQHENLKGEHGTFVAELNKALAEVASLRATIQMRDSRDRRLFSLLGVENWTEVAQRLNAIINDQIDSAPISYIGPAAFDGSFAVEYTPRKWTPFLVGEEVALENQRCAVVAGETVTDGGYHCIIVRPCKNGEVRSPVMSAPTTIARATTKKEEAA